MEMVNSLHSIVTVMIRFMLPLLIGGILAACYKTFDLSASPDAGDTASEESPEYSGVDLLIVMDNSISMDQEQEKAATALFSLLGALFDPRPRLDRDYPPPQTLRFAVVSSDLGLRFGGVSQPSRQLPNCVGPGDDGRFLDAPDTLDEVRLESGNIRCFDNERICPMGRTCAVGGVCALDGEVPDTLSCRTGAPPWEIDGTAHIGALASRTVCALVQGSGGCGIEQQLEAAVRGLERQPEFMVDDHLLFLLFVSDEDDCSIEDPAFFETPEFQITGLESSSCHWPVAHEENLFSPRRYRDEIVRLKGDDDGVVFAAVVGVPITSDAACEGTGAALARRGCLEQEAMQLEMGSFPHPTVPGSFYPDFTPACERRDRGSGEILTQARPARRFVEVAAAYGENGYIYSICNEDWSAGMGAMAEIVLRRMSES